MPPFNLASYLSQNAAGVGLLGAIVGGSAAAAQAISDHKRGYISREQAIRVTGTQAAGAGVATAVSAVAAGLVGGGLILSLGTAFVAATAAKFAWDRGLEGVARLRDPKRPVDAELVR
jgi:hypothetical protein